MKHVALCIGHSRSGDDGAVNTRKVSEHTFNSELGKMVQDLLEEKGFKATLIDKYEGSGYSSAISWVGKKCREIKADIALEFHFNSAGPYAEGHEWLYWHRSQNSMRLAECFKKAFAKAYPDSRSRGIKPCDAESRGSLFLRLTPCPSLILEPYFGSNKSETENYSTSLPLMASAYADAVAAYFA